MATTLMGAQAAPAQAHGRCAAAEAKRAAVTAALRALLDSVRTAHPEVPGIALSVEAPALCLTWSGTTGVVDRASRAPLALDHAHRIASNTKTYVAVAILRLVEEGKLSLDDPLPKHLPEATLAPLRHDGYAVDRITIRQLLTHTSGLFDYAMSDSFAAAIEREPQRRWTRQEQVERAARWGDPYGPPGTLFHYSDTGYILLGEILERVTRRPYAAAVRALVDYTKLGLDATYMESLESVPNRVLGRAHQYQQGVDTYEWDPSIDLYGGGGIAATMRDLAVFVRAAVSGRVFKRASTVDVFKTLVVHPSQVDYYAGLRRRIMEGVELFGHSGYWNTFAYHSPAFDITLAGSVTENRSRATSGLVSGAVRILRDAVREP